MKLEHSIDREDGEPLTVTVSADEIALDFTSDGCLRWLILSHDELATINSIVCEFHSAKRNITGGDHA
jgi:hypothetical protein